MPKKKWTPEERAAFGAKMKAAREAKRDIGGPPPESAPRPEETINHNDDLELLKKRIAELESKQFFSQPQVTSTKQVVTKYSWDPKLYPDPRERLAAEPKLARIAFPLNYDLDWEVQKIDYEEDGLKVRSPRFLLQLLGKVIDEETNEIAKKYDPATKKWTEQRYIIKKGMFFEDPDSFIAVANEMNIDVPEFLEKPFLDEMRYMVIRDWLLENFFPPKTLGDKTQKTETVIDNRLVEVFEINSDINNPTPKMPFKD